MDFSNLGGLGDLAKQMQGAYADGMGAMNQAGKEVSKDMNPDYEIDVYIKLSAKVEGHDYKVDAKIIFSIELGPVLDAANSPAADLGSLLDGLGVDLGDDKEAVMDQLGQPRAIGVVKSIDTKTLMLSNGDGPVDATLNSDGTLLTTINDGKIQINFESVLSFPNNSDVYMAIPSMEQMQKNIVVPVDSLEGEITFNWVEKDKDNLKVEGKLRFRKV